MFRLALIALASFCLLANPVSLHADDFVLDSHEHTLRAIERDIDSLSQSIDSTKDDIQVLFRTMEANIDALKAQYADQSQKDAGIQAKIARMDNALQRVTAMMQAIGSDEYLLRKKVDNSLAHLSRNLRASENLLHIVCLVGLFVLVAVVAVCAMLIVQWQKKMRLQESSILALSETTDTLSTEVMEQFIKAIDKAGHDTDALLALLAKHTNVGIVKKIADRLAFMEVTMTKMDPSVRGFKQLAKSIRQMKDNLKANGYDIVDMLGKSYNAGMRVVANFIDDENMEKGKQIITGIVKPQINYKGLMIQSAQITVTQNL